MRKGVFFMLIQCTKKLLNQLKVKPEPGIEEEALFSWHTNIITVNRRKTVVLVNDKNRYSIVLYGLKAKDLKEFDQHIREAVRRTLEEEYIKDDLVEKFINNSGDIVYAKTRNRSLVSRMNESCRLVEFYSELLDESSIYQPALSKSISQMMVGDGEGGYIDPNEEFYQDLEALSGENIFSCQAAVIMISLALEKEKVWRRLVVPVNISFAKLHQVIQAAFGWKDYHLHEFYIYGEEKTDISNINHSGYHKDGLRPIICLIGSEEDLEYQDDYVKMKLEKGIRLSKYLPARIKYNYDFGDNWQHYLEVEEIIDDYSYNYPQCLTGEGNTPPEDVGGKYGYQKFLEIIADPDHPDYDSMMDWGQSQGYKEFDLEEVNKAIKRRY